MNFKDLKVKNKITVAVIGIAILASISGIVSAFMMSGIQNNTTTPWRSSVLPRGMSVWC